MEDMFKSLWSARHENAAVVLLRWSLAVIFIWFGLIKVSGYNLVFDLVYSVVPSMATGTGFLFLGLIEVVIGVGLLINRWRFAVTVILVAHLVGTFVTFVTAPDLVFQPHFPILSLAGEFVMKNLTLAIAGIVVLIHEAHRDRSGR
jgi:putative oxidoreductase